MPFWLSNSSVKLLHKYSIMTLLKHDMIITEAAAIHDIRHLVDEREHSPAREQR